MFGLTPKARRCFCDSLRCFRRSSDRWRVSAPPITLIVLKNSAIREREVGSVDEATIAGNIGGRVSESWKTMASAEALRVSPPIAIPVMTFLLILAHVSEPASTAKPVPRLAAAAALHHSSAPEATPLADSAPSSATSGLLHLRVKHGPFEGASSIQVTVRNVQVQKADAPAGLDWITLIKGEKTFDLVGSEQGEDVLIGKELAEGLYSRVQLDFVSVKVALKGQRKSAKLIGNRLKEIRPFSIDMARVCILTLDFDAAKSMVVTDSGEIQFKPVVRFIVRRGSPG